MFFYTLTVPRCHPGAAVLRPLHPPRTRQRQHQDVLLKQREPAHLFEPECAQQGVASVTFHGRGEKRQRMSVFIGAQNCKSTGPRLCKKKRKGFSLWPGEKRISSELMFRKSEQKRPKPMHRVAIRYYKKSADVIHFLSEASFKYYRIALCCKVSL